MSITREAANPKTSWASKTKSNAKLTKRVHVRCQTGCITCRIRRVKCDEPKPSCLRCASTGRKCDGYKSTPQNNDSQKSLAIQCRMLSEQTHQMRCVASTSLSIFSPSLNGTLEEQHGLHHFRYRTAIEFSGYFGFDFWDSVVLRLSFFEPSVRYAMLALSTIHEVYERAGDYDPNHNQNPRQQRLALGQYNESIRQTHQLIAQTDFRSSDVALVSCILYICQELMQYNYYGAMDHIKMGLRIYKPNPSSKINKVLGQLFSQFLLQSMFLGKPHFNPRILPNIDVCSPTLFQRLEDPRDSLQLLFAAAHRFVYFSWQKEKLIEVAPDPILAEAIKQTQYEKLSADIMIWQNHFLDFIYQQSDWSTARHSTGIDLLEIHYTCLKIMLIKAAKLQNSTNLILTAFAKVVSIIKRVLNLSTSYLPTCSFDVGIIGPLFYAATQCPSSTLRWEALALLKHQRVPYREGIWGVTMSTRLAERIVETGGNIVKETREARETQHDLRSIGMIEDEHVELPFWEIKKVSWQLEIFSEVQSIERAHENKRAWRLLVGDRKGQIDSKREEVVTW